MAGASRFIMLLANPLPWLFHTVRPCPSLLRLTRHSHFFPSSLTHIHHHLQVNTLSFTSRQLPLKLLPSKPKSSRAHLHIQSQFTVPDGTHSPSSQYRWPEFCKLLDAIPRRQQFPAVANYDISPGDSFVAAEDLPHEFLSAARDCLTFSYSQPDLLGSLSRRDLEVVVANGTPFLFKSELDSARRMKAFLGIGGSTVSESTRANTVDLMKYLLTYASYATVLSRPNNSYGTELLILSCRSLLNELSEMSYRLSRSGLSAPHQYQFSGGFEQPPRPYGGNIEMKRGDWICQKCSFMNFARNVKCLECEEPRPQRQLTGGEWDCPQCDFFNYGRNTVCLRCDCKRPGETSFGTINSSSGLGYSNMDYANKADVDRRLATNEEKAERWFSKVSQLNSDSDLISAATDEDFPEIMPLRKGVNRFVMSTRKTPLERRLADSQHRRSMGNDVSQEDNYSLTWSPSKNLNTSDNQRPDQILCQRSSLSEADNCRMSAGQNVGTESCTPSVMDSPQYKQHKGGDSNCSSGSNEPKKSGEHILFSGKTEMQAGSLDKEREQVEKPETWFKRVAEIHDVKDLTSEISDDEFPEIMPVRKGENRFVVSKKKDSSLTSPMYKRQVAVEQANSGNHVPFVAFPPGYFAKKDKQQVEDTDSTVKSTTESISSVKKEGLDNMTCAQEVENQKTNTVKWNSNSFGGSGMPMNGDSAQNSYNFTTITEEAQVSGYSEKVNSPQTVSMSRNSSQLPQNQNVSGWAGKSLEGSAVKETDPLDMSEEAKAERWFRRVAQIKDISELSQIPDEDFPSIMPMRKGVNRFVVSKRKTPLERRLTSPQYRRNLPIVSCDPEKENDSS